MRRGTTVFVAGGLLLLAACTRTVVVTQAPPPERRYRGSRPPPNSPPEPASPPARPADPSPPPSNPPTPPAPPPPPRAVVRLMIPPGQLPDLGECRVWIPAMPPGLQPRPRSRPCAGIEAIAGPGRWIVYRPREDRRLVHVRVLDKHRRGTVTRIRVFDIESQELVREEEPRPPEQRPPVPPREVIPPVQPPPDSTPREQRPPPPVQPPRDSTPVQPPRDSTPRRPPDNKPPEPPAGPSSAVTLDIPPGHLPELGACRVWIPGLPPGRQPRPKSRPCDGIMGVAPAGSWIIDRPRATPNLVYVRMVDERRAGVLIRIRIFDLDSRRLVREENP